MAMYHVAAGLVATGVMVTVATIWLVTIVDAAVTWRWASAVLALGPAVGIASLAHLPSLPESAQIGRGRG